MFEGWTRKSLTALVLFGAAVAAVTQVPGRAVAAEDPITLSFAYYAPETSWPGPVMTKWAERIGEETDGKVVVKFFPSGSLLGRAEMFDGVKTGIVDIGMSIISDPGRFPLQYGFGLLLDIPNAVDGSKLLFDLVQEFDPQELRDFKVLTVFSGGPGYLQTREPITSLKDMKGREIRATGGGVGIISKLGANPVGMPITEVPQALQTGVIDGYMTSMTVLKDFKLAEMVGHVTQYPMNVATFAVVMNRDSWDALPADAQTAIDGIAREMAIYGGTLYDEEEVAAIEWAKSEHGVQFHKLDVTETNLWNHTIAPVIQEWENAQNAQGVPAEQFLERFTKLRAALN